MNYDNALDTLRELQSAGQNLEKYASLTTEFQAALSTLGVAMLLIENGLDRVKRSQAVVSKDVPKEG